MIVAISTEAGMVAAHFGRCPSFTLVDVEGGQVKKQEVVGNPGHEPGFIPRFLRERGVECIVTGGMGMHAQQLFQEAGIRVVMGAEGAISEIIEAIVKDRLQEGESTCLPGEGKGYGVEKTVCDHPHEEEQ